MTFDISDALPLPQWHSQCRQLLELHKLRFSLAALPTAEDGVFRVPVLHESFRPLSLSMQDARLRRLAILRGAGHGQPQYVG